MGYLWFLLGGWAALAGILVMGASMTVASLQSKRMKVVSDWADFAVTCWIGENNFWTTALTTCLYICSVLTRTILQAREKCNHATLNQQKFPPPQQ